MRQCTYLFWGLVLLEEDTSIQLIQIDSWEAHEELIMEAWNVAARKGSIPVITINPTQEKKCPTVLTSTIANGLKSIQLKCIDCSNDFT